MRQTVQSRKPRWIVCLLAPSLLFFADCGRSSQPQTQRSYPSHETIDVGMVALLAVPEKYERKLVRIIGFVCIEFEGDALYLHEEDYRYGLTKDSFVLHLTDAQQKQFKNMSLKYVLIEGTLNANGPERNDWAGAIENITRFEIWPADRGPTQHR
jgi:hypothetical protein